MFEFSFVRARAWSSRAGAHLIFLASGAAACASTASAPRDPTSGAEGSRAAPPRALGDEGRTQPLGVPALRGPVLERAAYVRAVLQRNPTIEAARHGFRAAIARARGAGSFDDSRVDLRVAPLSIGSTQAPLGYEVAISQQLPWFGKRSLEARAAAAEANAIESDYEGVRRGLALTALDLYDQYFVVHRSLEINAAHVKLMTAMRDSATAQFGAGRGSAQDSLQAEAELAHLEHDALILASQRDVVVAQMNELLHRAPELPLPPPPDELAMPAPLDASAASLQSEAVGKRPEIAAARQRAQAEGARANRAERDAYPDVTVSTSYSSMWEMAEHRFMVGFGLNLPIWNGKRSATAEEAVAMRAHFESEVVRTSDAARTQVFVSMKQLQESEHVLRLMETRLLPVAREQIDAARAGFVTSQNPFAAVIQAEKNLRQVELEYQLARAGYARRRGELDWALGRMPGLGWKERDR